MKDIKYDHRKLHKQGCEGSSFQPISLFLRICSTKISAFFFPFLYFKPKFSTFTTILPCFPSSFSILLFFFFFFFCLSTMFASMYIPPWEEQTSFNEKPVKWRKVTLECTKADINVLHTFKHDLGLHFIKPQFPVYCHNSTSQNHHVQIEPSIFSWNLRYKSYFVPGNKICSIPLSSEFDESLNQNISS